MLPCNCEVTGHCMCKEMLVIPVNRVVDKKRIIGKMAGRGGGEEQRVSDQKIIKNFKYDVIVHTTQLNISLLFFWVDICPNFEDENLSEILFDRNGVL
jgi:hypothetical protein